MAFKKFLQTVLLSSLLALVIIAQAVPQTAAVESFNYANGALLDGLGAAGNGWGSPWIFYQSTDSTFYVTGGAIDYTSLNYTIPNAGLQVKSVEPIDGTAMRMYRYLAKPWPVGTAAAGKTYWISAVLECDNIKSTSCWASVAFWDSTNEGPDMGKGWGDNVYSFGSGAPGASEKSTTTWDSGPVWLVGRVDNLNNAGGSNDSLKLHMWVTPDPTGGEPDTAKADTRSIYVWGTRHQFSTIFLHYGAYGGTGLDKGTTLIADEIRVGTSWADVSSPLTAIKLENKLPFQFSLSQNYPNPFNPSTNIIYSVPTESKVRLVVYNMLGSEVAVLANGIQTAGQHVISFSGNGLSSGIYFYRLQAGNEVITKKMTLLK